jgi:hypothetical protein
MATYEHSEGWITFAAILAGVAGVVNGVVGLGAIANAHALTQYGILFTNLNAWGWLTLLFGVLQIVAAFLLMARSNAGRILAMVLASISLVLWVMLIGALPLAGLIAVALDILVIYGLSVTSEYFQTSGAYNRHPSGTAPSGGMPAGSR